LLAPQSLRINLPKTEPSSRTTSRSASALVWTHRAYELDQTHVATPGLPYFATTRGHPFQQIRRRSIGDPVSSLSLERPLRIAYLGPRATFTHIGGMQQSALAAQYVPVESIKDVSGGRAGAGWISGWCRSENSTEGRGELHLDMFIDSDLKITARYHARGLANLMNRSGNSRTSARFYTHPRCPASAASGREERGGPARSWTRRARRRAAEMAKDDADSALSQGEMGRSLRPPDRCQEIEDNPQNFTRFIVISKKPKGRRAATRPPFMFSIKDKVAALHSMLSPFAEAGINLNRLDARPSGRQVWDMSSSSTSGPHRGAEVAEAVEQLKKDCMFLKVLRAYPESIVLGQGQGPGSRRQNVNTTEEECKLT